MLKIKVVTTVNNRLLESATTHPERISSNCPFRIIIKLSQPQCFIAISILASAKKCINQLQLAGYTRATEIGKVLRASGELSGQTCTPF